MQVYSKDIQELGMALITKHKEIRYTIETGLTTPQGVQLLRNALVSCDFALSLINSMEDTTLFVNGEWKDAAEYYGQIRSYIKDLLG